MNDNTLLGVPLDKIRRVALMNGAMIHVGYNGKVSREDGPIVITEGEYQLETTGEYPSSQDGTWHIPPGNIAAVMT